MKLGLVLNPGSTSTKIGVFAADKPLVVETLRHSQAELSGFIRVPEQREFRLKTIMEVLSRHNIELADIAGVIAIGGMLKSGDAGVYEVNEAMIRDLMSGDHGDHASNLGGIIGRDFALARGIKAYVADPVTSDELQEVAKLSGLPHITRKGRAHTLNQKSVAMQAAKQLGKTYPDSRLIVAHLGGGTSVAAHQAGRMVDDSSGEGPFSMDRPGGLSPREVVKMCFSDQYSQEEIWGMFRDQGGIAAYLGTKNFREVEIMKQNGSQKAALVYASYAYQIAKSIGAMAAVLEGQVDAIVFTGGAANSTELIATISRQVSFIAPILVYPGENELAALAHYLQQVLSGEIVAKQYC